MSTGVREFEDLAVWQQSRQLCNQIYAVTRGHAFSRDFGLKDQIQRSAVSVLSNISEGYESRTRGLYIDYLGRAKGSAGEVRGQLYIALDAGYIERHAFEQLYALAKNCSSMLHNLITALQRK